MAATDITPNPKKGEDRPHLTIDMIFGGNEINGVNFSLAKKTMILVNHSKRLKIISKDDITFTEEDIYGLLLPYKNAMIISLSVLDL